jgi:hypothetical protein
MNDESLDYPAAYRLSRLGFFLMAVGLVPICILEVATLAGSLADRRILRWIDRTGIDNVLDTTTPWATLAGATVLWIAWEFPSWRRRAGLLLTMCLVDVACWFINLGDPNNLGAHVLLRRELQAAMGWAQFALIASLAGDMLGHLGVQEAEESSRSTRSLAATGTVIWMLFFLETTDLHAGWPLQRIPALTVHAWLLGLANVMIHAICLIQVTALVVAALRRLNDFDEAGEEKQTAPQRSDESGPYDDFDYAAQDRGRWSR